MGGCVGRNKSVDSVDYTHTCTYYLPPKIRVLVPTPIPVGENQWRIQEGEREKFRLAKLGKF